jgi:putative ABC transport system permease protein
VTRPTSPKQYIESVWLDVRYARRVLAGTPAFTLTALATLGLAIGVNTAVFALVNAVLLEPLPYPHPERLTLLSHSVRQNGPSDGNTSVDGRTWELVRDRATRVDRAVFSSWTTGVNLVVPGSNGSDRALFVQQQRVGCGFFSVLGVSPLVGREFTTDEDRPNGPAAVVLSAELWRTTFGADPTAVGRPIALRGESYTVVGIMPDGFQTGAAADLWTPLRPSTTGEGGGSNYQVVIRLRDDGSRPQALAEIAGIADELQRQRPVNSEGQVSLSLVGLHDGMTSEIRPALLIVWAAVGVVLIVACVNLAGLMLTRAARRRREMATRLALGSGRAAVVRQLLVEAVVLGIAGGALGLAVAAIAVQGLSWLSRDALDIWQTVSIGGREAAVAAGLSILGSLIFGLGPALQASRQSTQSSLLASGRSVAGATSHWPRRVLVVAQVGLGVLLLVGSGLLLRTFTHLKSLDPGFDPEHIVSASVSLEDARYRTADSVARLMENTVARVRQEPGVTSAAVGLGLPYERLLNLGFRHADGPEATEPRSLITSATYVTPGLFEVLQIPVRQGRSFDARDRAGSPPVVIVNDALVRTYFKGAEPVGRHVSLSGTVREIVGVVGDVQTRPGWGDNGPLSTMALMYVPIGQLTDGFVRLVHGWFMPAIVVRSPMPAAQTSGAIRRAVASVDPLLPLASVRTMSEVQAASLGRERLLTILLLTLAVAALVLAALGIHGLIAASVTERTREMGIRLALGATFGQALRTLALPGIVLAGAGTVAGLAGAVAAVPLIRHFVWGISVSDPLTYAGVVVVLLAVATAASVTPALRILRLDPATTLRQE